MARSGRGHVDHASSTNQSKSNFKLFYYLIVAFIPAALTGFFLHKKIDILMSSALAVGIAQILGALLIIIAERVSLHMKNKRLKLLIIIVN